MNGQTDFRVAHEINQVAISSLTPLEIDFFFSFVSDIAKNDDALKEYTISKKILEVKLDRRLSENRTRELIKRMLGKFIWIEDNKKMKGLPLFSELSFSKVTHDYSVRFNPELRPFLLKLQVFTLGNTKYLFALESKYQKQMYLLMSQWKKRGKFTIKVATLMDSFKLPLSLRIWGHFKARVLDASAKAFFEKSDVIFDWKVTKKKGRTIDEITFTIQDNPHFKKSKLSLFDDVDLTSEYDEFYGKTIVTKQGSFEIVMITPIGEELRVSFKDEEGYVSLPNIEALTKAIGN